MISPLHVATLGIGFGAASMAFIGLVDYADKNYSKHGAKLSAAYSSIIEIDKPKNAKRRRSEEFAMMVLM